MGCTQSPPVRPAPARRVSIAEPPSIDVRVLGLPDWPSLLQPSTTAARGAQQIEDGAALQGEEVRQIEVVCEDSEEPLPKGCAALVAKLGGCMHAHRVELEIMHGSRSGAVVLLMTPYRADGQMLPISVVKFDRGGLRAAK